MRAALALLDEGGDRAVTFRALAAKLDVTPMAITHHVGTRKQLFASLVARVYRDVGTEPLVAEPKARIRIMLERYCQCVIAHPNLVQCVFADPSLFSGQLVALTNAIAENLAMSGLESPQRETLGDVIIDYTHGFAFSAAAYSDSDKPNGNAIKKQTIDDYLRGLGWLLDNIA